MKLLLDTHVLIWYLNDNPSLSVAARNAIEDLSNQVFVSSVSLAEIRIKQSIGRLRGLPDKLLLLLQNESFSFLDFKVEHAIELGLFEYHHRDPFDWMLIAQCRIEKMTFITRDREIVKYDLSILNA